MNFVEEINWKIFEGGSISLRKAIASLLTEAENASGKAGIEFVRELLNRYTYLSRDDYDDGIILVADKIQQNFDLGRTLLCATAADHQKDSAQMVLYDLTTAMGLYGHVNILSANRYDRAQKFVDQVDDIVLVDEFVGTGGSIVGRIRTISKQFADKGVAIPKIHAYVLAGMDFGLDLIRGAAASVWVNVELKPGLRGYLEGESLSNAYVTLSKIESELAENVKGNLLPNRGDGECEALYARKMGNCPNSVLPMFWWPHDKNGAARVRPFTRIF